MRNYFLCCVPFFGKNRDIFMAVICDMAMGRLVHRRYVLGIVHDGIKTGFMRRKEFLHANGIYCVLLAINSSKQRKDNLCLARYRWCLLSVYHDMSYKKQKQNERIVSSGSRSQCGLI